MTFYRYFTIEFVNKIGVSTPHSVGDSIYIRPVDYGDSQLKSTPLNPVMIIPIKNADTFDEQAAPEKAVGPEFPNHEDGSARDSGGGLTRTDEYITYLLSKASWTATNSWPRPIGIGISSR